MRLGGKWIRNGLLVVGGIIVAGFLFFSAYYRWKENKLLSRAYSIRAGMEAEEVIKVLGRPKSEGWMDSADFIRGWEITRTSADEIKRHKKFYYYLYYNQFFAFPAMRKMSGAANVYVYFDETDKRVVHAGRTFLISEQLLGRKKRLIDDIDAFFRNPIENFERMKKAMKKSREPGRILSLYIRWSRDLEKWFFFSNNQELDDRRLEILMFLLSHYRGEEIAAEAAEIFSLRPAMFIKELEQTFDWKGIIDAISVYWEMFSLGFSGLGSSQFESEVKDYAISLHKEREIKLKDIEAFINDPEANFDKIKMITDISGMLHRYELSFADNGHLFESPISALLRHFNEINEKKIEILIYLVSSGFSGCRGDLLMDKAVHILRNHQQVFLVMLEKTEVWKEVVYEIAFWSPKIYKEFMEELEKARDSKYAKEIIKYLAAEKKKVTG